MAVSYNRSFNCSGETTCITFEKLSLNSFDDPFLYFSISEYLNEHLHAILRHLSFPSFLKLMMNTHYWFDGEYIVNCIFQTAFVSECGF